MAERTYCNDCPARCGVDWYYRMDSAKIARKRCISASRCNRQYACHTFLCGTAQPHDDICGGSRISGNAGQGKRNEKRLTSQQRRKAGICAGRDISELWHVNTLDHRSDLKHKPAIQRSDCGFERRKTFAVEMNALARSSDIQRSFLSGTGSNPHALRQRNLKVLSPWWKIEGAGKADPFSFADDIFLSENIDFRIHL